MRHGIRGLFFGAGLATLFGAQALAADVSKIYLGVGNTSSEFFSEFIAGAKAVATSEGKDVQVIIGNYTGQQLLEQFGAIFSQGCDNCIVAVDPASNAFTKVIVNRIVEGGGKVVTIWNRPDNIHPWDTSPEGWVAHTTFDGIEMGRLNGGALCKALGGTGNIVVLNGIPDNPPAKQHLTGLGEAVKACPGMKILDTQVANWDQTQAQAATRAWLARYGNQINGIFASNDSMALGAVAALREKGLAGKIPVTGEDGTREALNLVKSGEMLSTMFVDAYVQGAYAVALASAVVKGDVSLDKLTHAQRDYYQKQIFVTKENVDQVLGAKPDPANYTYDKLKTNLWSNSVGQIPAGVN